MSLKVSLKISPITAIFLILEAGIMILSTSLYVYKHMRAPGIIQQHYCNLILEMHWVSKTTETDVSDLDVHAPVKGAFDQRC